ncbi:MAG: nucleoside kinase [Lachnospiraceae bacterium]|nr:nucleoside kinase [Lachnospiraceae bacterium]
MDGLILKIAGEEREFPWGTTYEEIAGEYQKDYPERIALVRLNGKIRELNHKVERGGELEFMTLADPAGHKAYVRTAIMLLMKAFREETGVHDSECLKVEFTIGPGYYCTPRGNLQIDQDLLDRVERRMRREVEKKTPITKKSMPIGDAVAVFAAQGMEDKVSLFRYRRSSSINVYHLGDYADYNYGYMLPDVSYLHVFSLKRYRSGFVLILPDRKTPETLPAFEDRKNLFLQLRRNTYWGRMMGIETVGDLNDLIVRGETEQIILVQEALQERRIGELARRIFERSGVKFVMIAGPSSSGKTTFANRLAIQLRTWGLHPHLISLDDYYLNRELAPLDEHGKPNFECLEALNVEGFNQDMKTLLNGGEVELPRFNFLTGKSEKSGNVIRLSVEDILIIEGIHGINDRMSHALPNESKFKIYISALTTLSVDLHNRIPTTDARLLRRIVRDARTRGSSAEHTIGMWDSVRAGEENYIFPFQESADEMFNSAQIYELAILKQFAEPLLFAVRPGTREYDEAKRLLKFLDYFVGMDQDALPRNSICREFVGGSCFRV